MLLAITAGLGGRLHEAVEYCAGQGVRPGALLQLGDLPLEHDFARVSQRGHSKRMKPASGCTVADYVHGRRALPFPLIFLCGERDDETLALHFAPDRHSRGSSAGKRSGSVYRQTQPGPNYLASGGVLKISTPDVLLAGGGSEPRQNEGESLLVGALSGFGRSDDRVSGTLRSCGDASRREASRRLLACVPGAIPLLLSHDSPETLTAAARSASEQESEPSNNSRSQASDPPGTTGRDQKWTDERRHPGWLFLRTIDHLQPRAAFHGHAASAAAWTRGRTSIYSLPTASKPEHQIVIAWLNTLDYSVELSVIAR